jgi:hypothetical protein
MAMQPGKPNIPPSKHRKDEQRKSPQTTFTDAETSAGEDRDLVNGEGGTLGLGSPDDLNRDD